MDKRDEYRALWLQIQETEKKFARAKLKRNAIVVLCFSAVFFGVFYMQRNPEGLDILGEALTAIIVGCVHFIVNALVFTHLVHIGDSERKLLESMERKLSELSETP